jgi:hypothetical protein
MDARFCGGPHRSGPSINDQRSIINCAAAKKETLTETMKAS